MINNQLCIRATRHLLSVMTFFLSMSVISAHDEVLTNPKMINPFTKERPFWTPPQKKVKAIQLHAHVFHIFSLRAAQAVRPVWWPFLWVCSGSGPWALSLLMLEAFVQKEKRKIDQKKKGKAIYSHDHLLCTCFIITIYFHLYKGRELWTKKREENQYTKVLEEFSLFICIIY